MFYPEIWTQLDTWNEPENTEPRTCDIVAHASYMTKISYYE